MVVVVVMVVMLFSLLNCLLGKHFGGETSLWSKLGRSDIRQSVDGDSLTNLLETVEELLSNMEMFDVEMMDVEMLVLQVIA